MSSAAAATADAPLPNKGNKKLILIGAAVAVLLLGGGGAAFMVMKSKAAAAEAAAEEGEDGEHAPKAKSAKKADPKAVPVFTPLEMFTVNLANRDSERYAQVGITLEVDSPETETRLKALMPAVRNQILLAIGDRRADDIANREGKAALALRIKLDTSRVLGAEFDDADFGIAADPAVAADSAAADDEKSEKSEKATKSSKAKKAKKSAVPELPITAVHFSNFIIQ